MLPPELASLTALELETLAAVARWRDVPAGDPIARATSAIAAGVPLGLGPSELRALAAEVHTRGGDGDALSHEAAARAVASRSLALASDAEIARALAHDTTAAIALLESLRDDALLASRTRKLFPELAALLAADALAVSPEYEGRASRTALLDHLTLRTLSRKLAGLERNDLTRFQPGADAPAASAPVASASAPASSSPSPPAGSPSPLPRLSRATFDALVARTQRLEARGLLPLVRAALVFRDVAKPARDAATSAASASRLVHNETAASLLLSRAREPGTGVALLARSLERSPFGVAEVALFVAAHGLVGQHLRGECPLAALARFVVGARRMSRLLNLGRGDGAALVADALAVMDACDVASVREGLLDDALAARFARVEDGLAELVAARDSTYDNVAIVADALARLDDTGAALGEHSPPSASPAPPSSPASPASSSARVALEHRLARLRAARLAALPAARDELHAALAAVPDREAAALHAALANCHLWYAEAATGDLAPAATIKLLALALSAATAANLRPADASLGHHRMFHVDLLPLAQYLTHLGPSRTYALRLIEAVLAPISLSNALALDGALTPPVRALLGDPVAGDARGLGALAVVARGERAIALEWRASREADALLTLLGIYESKSSAAFHATLKSLCDLYGLRKDDFDRIHAEAAYLDAMNSARSDKARLCDYVPAGTILEVGPGGGVVLDLLAERFPTSRVIGLDVSRAVVEELANRRARENRRWDIVEGDAFQMEETVGKRALSAVVFCSILHEIYSYVPWDDGDGRGPGKFRMGSVRALVAEAFRCLAPRGRIVVRDGVMPPPGWRVIEFKTREAEETFALYAREFEGRRIAWEPAGPRRVRLSSADAQAFLFTFVWGPASFPYEIREQYGVETYERYADVLLRACSEADPPYRATLVPLPPDIRSYLQRGYVDHLAPHVALYEPDGATPARLPDSNALWVIEKTEP